MSRQPDQRPIFGAGAVLNAIFSLALMAAGTGNARAYLDVTLCNSANVDLWDCFDLVSLYNATDGDNWTNNTNWGSPNVDSWHGVIVDGVSHRVIAIDLAINGLDGEFPPAMYGLQQLEFLQLSVNGLYGELPAYLGDLSSLEFLQVGSNDLQGSLPSSLGNLSRLENLYLTGNRLSGSIPASFGNLTRLEVLDISSDGMYPSERLSGPLPDLSGLTRLRRINLERNELDGPLPAYLGQLPLLEELRLWHNHFSGAIPASLGNLGNLRVLDLAENDLTGALPASLGNLGALEELDLSVNDFTSTLPPTLGNLAQLRTLNIRGSVFNPQMNLTGPIPASFANLGQLEEMNLAFNRLSGALPACLGNLDNLQAMNLQGNELIGAIPEAFTALKLQTLYLGLNFLDADGSGQLITTPTIETWLNGIPDTENYIVGFGWIDTRDQRIMPNDPDTVFISGFESAISSACP